MDVAVKSAEHIFSSRGFSSYLSPQKLMISPFPTLNISLVAVTSLQNNEALWLFLCFSLVDPDAIFVFENLATQTIGVASDFPPPLCDECFIHGVNLQQLLIPFY